MISFMSATHMPLLDGMRADHSWYVASMQIMAVVDSRTATNNLYPRIAVYSFKVLDPPGDTKSKLCCTCPRHVFVDIEPV